MLVASSHFKREKIGVLHSCPLCCSMLGLTSGHNCCRRMIITCIQENGKIIITCHRQSYVEMTQYSEHVTFQLPGERSRVRYLLDCVITTDASLLAAIDNLGLEAKGMIDDFENTAANLLMHGPVAKRKSVSGPSNIDQLTHVSEETARLSLSSSNKVSKCKTGVDFRFYKRKEFMNLFQ